LASIRSIAKRPRGRRTATRGSAQESPSPRSSVAATTPDRGAAAVEGSHHVGDGGQIGGDDAGGLGVTLSGLWLGASAPTKRWVNLATPAAWTRLRGG
jgi:hypothetical protein